MYASNLYGQILYGSESGSSSINDAYIDLMTYLPDYYQHNNKMTELQKILGYGIGALLYNVSDTVNQCFISSATWGLDRWESIFGLTTDSSESYVRRREILKAKLRGSGTTTKDMIKNTAVAFSGGDVSVIEYPEEYRFVVQFIGVRGIPSNMAGLINAIEDIKPAHLVYNFKYTYTTWSMISLTWAGTSGNTWAELKVYNEGE